MSDKPPAKPGRPSDFTQALADEICERLSEGEPLAAICRDSHMPSRQTVHEWRKGNEEFSLHFARAREDGYDSIAFGLRDTARGKGESTKDVQRDKLIIDTDLKLLSKWDPKRYGDKLEIDATVKGDLKVTIGGDV